VNEKEQKKLHKSCLMAMEQRSLRKFKIKVTATVVGDLDTVLKGLEKNLKTSGTTTSVKLLQKIALLGKQTAYILRSLARIATANVKAPRLWDMTQVLK